MNRDIVRWRLFRDDLYSPMREIGDEMVMKENPNASGISACLLVIFKECIWLTAVDDPSDEGVVDAHTESASCHNPIKLSRHPLHRFFLFVGRHRIPHSA